MRPFSNAVECRTGDKKELSMGEFRLSPVELNFIAHFRLYSKLIYLCSLRAVDLMDFGGGITGKHDNHLMSFVLYAEMSGTLPATGPPYEAYQSITAHRL